MTKRGRQLLAKGIDEFKITQFALADDEIDYRLWNPNHTLGTNYYGEAISGMPILEANPNEIQMLKYKLVTLSRDTTRIPVISVGKTSIILVAGGQQSTISPTTINFANGNATFGYTAILSDSDICFLRAAAGSSLTSGVFTNETLISEFGRESISVVAHKFELIAKPQVISDGNATLTIIGNETGGRIVINITVQQETTATLSANLAQTE